MVLSLYNKIQEKGLKILRGCENDVAEGQLSTIAQLN